MAIPENVALTNMEDNAQQAKQTNKNPQVKSHVNIFIARVTEP
jgi:hypothetical protein